MKTQTHMLDVIGIGLGPFNLSLAALLANKTDLKATFFEKKAQFNWHQGMILPNTTLQVPFLADLVTLVDPTSPYSYLNYLHVHHRLLKFYFVEDFKVQRKEYNHYCQWVTTQLDSLQFDSSVVDVSPYEDNGDAGFAVSVKQGDKVVIYHAKHIVIGTGTHPSLPKCLQNVADQSPHRCMHSADFSQRFDLQRISNPHKQTKVLVIGSGQSAAEVYRELFDRQLDGGNPRFQLDWITRSSGFFPMEYSPLGLEHFSPAYTDYFYELDSQTKNTLLNSQDLLYKGMGFCTIQDIYHRLYERSIANQDTHSMLVANCAVLDAQLTDSLYMTLEQVQQKDVFTVNYDCVIASTGYQHRFPSCFDTILSQVDYDQFGQPIVSRDYRLAYTGKGTIFVQNQELHTHGVGTPDLGLGAYRAASIVNQLAGETLYDTEALTVFQEFGVSRSVSQLKQAS